MAEYPSATVKPTANFADLSADLQGAISEALNRATNIRARVTSDKPADDTKTSGVPNGMLAFMDEQATQVRQLNVILDQIQTSLGD